MIVAAQFRKIEFKGPLRLRNKTVISDLYENEWNGSSGTQLALYQRGILKWLALERKEIESEWDSGLRGEAYGRLPILVESHVHVQMPLLCSKHLGITNKFFKKENQNDIARVMKTGQRFRRVGMHGVTGLWVWGQVFVGLIKQWDEKCFIQTRDESQIQCLKRLKASLLVKGRLKASSMFASWATA